MYGGLAQCSDPVFIPSPMFAKNKMSHARSLKMKKIAGRKLSRKVAKCPRIEGCDSSLGCGHMSERGMLRRHLLRHTLWV